MEQRDYYEILGVARNADLEEIKKAYRQQAMKFHPDRNPGDSGAEEKFKEASEAYEVLRDPEKRKIYDAYGYDGLKGRGFSGFSDLSDIFSSFGDIFENFFGMGGMGGGRHHPRRGADLSYHHEISLRQAVFGAEAEIEIEKIETCEHCQGRRTADGSPPATCRTCGGRGQVIRSQGFFSLSTPCPKCRGEGVIVEKPCRECRGQGLRPRRKKLSVKIPPGVDHGLSIRLPGEGQAGERGGGPGDLYVVLSVRPEEGFERQGDTIYTLCRIPFVQAALGASVEVPTLDGPKKIEIPPGSQSGDEVRIPGAGAYRLRHHGRGDQVVRLLVVVPKKLKKEEEELLRQYAAASGIEVAAKKGGFFKR